MERRIPDAGLVVFEGAGHFSYADQPARFGVVTRHFLAGPDPEPRPEPGPAAAPVARAS